MKYIAHKEQEREQTIKEHLCGTAQLADEFAEKFGKGEWGYCCGKMHDIGKYSSEFQKRIRGESNAAVDHSAAGAQICNEERRIIFVYKLLYCRTSFRASGLWKLSRHGKCIKSGRTYEEKNL